MAEGDFIPVIGEDFATTLTMVFPDVLRTMMREFAQRMMDAEVEAVCRAAYGQVNTRRTNTRNGYRRREWGTQAGSIVLAIPRLRSGTYYPEWLLGHGPRAERILTGVAAVSFLLGVTVQQVTRLAEALGVRGLSPLQLALIARELDEIVTDLRNRPLDAGPHTVVWVGTLTQEAHEDGRTSNVDVLIATGLKADGHQDILGVEVASNTGGTGWLAFLNGLVARGLYGVRLVISDRRAVLCDAIASTLPGVVAAAPEAICRPGECGRSENDAGRRVGRELSPKIGD